MVLDCVIRDCDVGPHIQHQSTLTGIRALLDEPEEMSERQNRSDIDSERSDEREPEYVWRVTVFPEGKHPASFRLEFGDALRAEQNIEMPCVVERAPIGKWEAVDD